MKRMLPLKCLLLSCTGTVLMTVGAEQAHSFNNSPAALGHNPTKTEKLVNIAKTDKSKTTTGAKNFIDNLASRALNLLKDDNIDQSALRENFRVLLDESFDVSTIARFALGRHWRAASKEQRKSYIQLFRKMVIEVYAKRFNDYEGQRFLTEDARMVNDTDAIVTSKVSPPAGEDGQRIKIEWRVRYQNNNYKIIDVIVEGVSMSITKRSDFSTVIRRNSGDISALLEHLREKYGEDGKILRPSPKPGHKVDTE